MAVGQGIDSLVTLGWEQAFGTVATVGKSIAVMGEELSGTQNQLDNASFGGDANTRDPVPGLIDAGGPLRHYLSAKTAPQIMKAFLGSPTTTGSSPYTHVQKTTTGALPTATIETYFNLATDEYKALLGATGDTLSIELMPEGFLMASCSFAGRETTFSTSPFDASPTDWTAETPFHHLQVAAADLILNGSAIARATALKINLDNQLKKQIYTLANAGKRYAITRGRQKVTGTISVLYEDQTEYDLAKAYTFFAVSAKWISGSTSFKIELPRIQLKQRDPVAKDDGPLMVDYDFIASKDSGVGSQIRTTTVNTIATY